jgi:CheY-like chemotaxis protein
MALALRLTVPMRRPKILVVHTDPMNQTLVSALRIGNVARARDHKSALAMLAASGQPFDVVVLDSFHPAEHPSKLPCLDLARSMFKRWPWIPVILVSGLKEVERLRPAVF